jgi:phospholipid/cholesterol/gamma-HCH transport system ATP-binding protein
MAGFLNTLQGTIHMQTQSSVFDDLARLMTGAIARAFASKPRHLLIDDPTSGLDPITSKTVDNEIVKLRDLEHVTSIVVTHQLQDAFYIASHEAVADNGHVRIRRADQAKADEAEFLMLAEAGKHFEGNYAALRASSDPLIKKFQA